MARSHLLRRLTAPVDLTRDHFIGNPDAEITLANMVVTRANTVMPLTK